MTKLGITVYGCDEDEAFVFQERARHFNVMLRVTSVALSEDTVGLAHGNQYISINHKIPVTNSTLRALSSAGVTYISTRSAGYNHIDITHAKSVGISVGNVTYSPDSVADYTLMLMLMAVRDTKSTISRVSTRDFRLNSRRGKELRDMTVGIIGTGRIGMAVIDRLQGFGCHTLAYDHRPKSTASYVSLDELLKRSDIVTLHTPLNASTNHLLDAGRIEQMKHGAFIINTGRGSLLDTEAVVSALQSGELGGAALDVLEGEEKIFYNDYRQKVIENRTLSILQKMPNVIITPHVAYYTEHALKDIVENTIINCLKFEEENI